MPSTQAALSKIAVIPPRDGPWGITAALIMPGLAGSSFNRLVRSHVSPQEPASCLAIEDARFGYSTLDIYTAVVSPQQARASRRDSENKTRYPLVSLKRVKFAGAKVSLNGS